MELWQIIEYWERDLYYKKKWIGDWDEHVITEEEVQIIEKTVKRLKDIYKQGDEKVMEKKHITMKIINEVFKNNKEALESILKDVKSGVRDSWKIGEDQLQINEDTIKFTLMVLNYMQEDIEVLRENAPEGE